ncbi:TonB-dependent receptor plug domain-containing protein [Sphingobium nicotianae]|uniref:TonB-dependent receptor n=1 Tax=Sphingobium nicotianae TaxID=2782607 RepID=A0A9X1DCB4_9SPHN|nr:TonB-dependent receptor [Sphingobium nicotianae]MBT2187326.1 TonB-dependent receptor [Sphingobium nicotianae]
MSAAWLASTALAIGLIGTGSAQAQTSQSSAETASDQAIIVTGSRLGRTTFDTPTPVTVLGGDNLKQLAITNVGVGLNQLPAFRASTSPATQGFGSFNVGANIVNLRGIGTSRNLVLVDGRRFAPSTREGTVDLNLVPSVLVGRIEVVTGGASAAYGSDAIAGAVNVILDKDFEGVKGQADYGVSGKGDGDNFHAGLAFGTKFAGGRGHFLIGGEYDDQKGIGNCFTRDWCTSGANVTNTGFATNGLPNLVRSNENAGWFFNSAGVVSINNNAAGTGATIRNLRGTNGITFSPTGAVLAYRPGSPAFGLSQIGGDLYPTYTDANITVPVTRYSAFAHADYEFSDRLSGFIEGSYGHIIGKLLQTAYFSASIPVFADNPYMPAEIRAIVGPAPGLTERPAAATFSLGRVLDDVGRGYSVSTADTYRFTTGLKGDLGGSWNWDAYYQYGRTDRLQTVENNLVTGDPTQSLTNPATYAAANARFQYAIDAVRDPVTGNPTCRALLSANAALRQAAAGCVPINLFGAGNVTPQGKAYIFGTLREDIRLQQHVLAANVRGDITELPAGPVSVAGGVEYRVDKISVVHDALSNQYAYFQNFGSDYRGTSKVLEGYAEVGVPLVKDASWTKSLSLDGAARVTRYDIQGFGSYLRAAASNAFTRATWKISGLWEPVDWLRLRVTQSHDIRAPNFAELFLASAGAFTPITNRFTNSANTPAIFSGGSPTVKPETADTTTAGIVIQPGSAAQGLRLSVDWYRIRVKDYIATAPGGVQQIVDRCFAGVQIACNLITFGANQSITQIRNVSLNLDRLTAQGIDFEAQYRYPLGEGSALTWRGLATYVSKLEATSFRQSIDRAGQTGQSAAIAAPDWIINSYLTYDGPLFSLTVQGRWITKGKYDAIYSAPGDAGYTTTVANSINNNNVGGRFYVNLFGSVRVYGDRAHGIELFGSVNNLFDRAPPAAPETQFYTNPTYFDTIGRYFRVGARFNF